MRIVHCAYPMQPSRVLDTRIRCPCVRVRSSDRCRAYAYSVYISLAQYNIINMIIFDIELNRIAVPTLAASYNRYLMHTHQPSHI